MLAKILMCECNANRFQRERNEYIEKHYHFYCHYNDEHQTCLYL